jgi:cobalt-zinc-cadmium efflux system outer membrane protein
VIFVAAALPVGLTVAAGAEEPIELTLARAQELALQRSPAYLAARQGEGIARGELRQSRLLSNPDSELEAPGLARGESLGSYQLSISQELEVAGQRGIRIQAAESAVEGARLSGEEAARQLLAGVSAAYFEAFAAARRWEVAGAGAALAQRLLDATLVQLREGKVSDLDANLAEIDAGRARGAFLRTKREAAAAQLELQRVIGLPPEQEIRLAEAEPEAPGVESQDVESLVELGLARRPDLAAKRAAVAGAALRLELARREAVPNLRIGPLAERDAAGEAARLGAVIGLSLPLWNRNQGTVEARRAELRQAELELQTLESSVRSEIAQAYRASSAASEEVETLRSSVIDPATENQRLLEIAYQAGKIGLPTVLLVRGQLLGAQLDYWDAWLAARRARALLAAVTSRPGEPRPELP